MASRKFFSSKPSYIYPITSDDSTSSDNNNSQFEFDESDVWTTGSDNHHVAVAPSPTEGRKAIPSSGSRKILVGGKKVGRPVATAAASLPVSVPDWSKILKEECNHDRRRDGGESDDDDVDDRTPPHEYLARTRGASLSVHEGIGRTLKGRDLWRVRNAILKKVGFED